MFVCSQEYVNGQLKNKYGDAFIRGNNGECSSRSFHTRERETFFVSFRFARSPYALRIDVADSFPPVPQCSTLAP